MKALLVKDAFVLWKQMRIFILILVVMSLVGGTFNSVFVAVWCSMLPYTAMAYDERSHWDQLAAMMPYSRRDVVLSKYVLGWICMALSVALTLVLQAAAVLIGRDGPEVALILASFLAGIIALDVSLPLIFRFGVERGRMVILIVIFGLAIVSGIAMDAVNGAGHISLPLVVLLPLMAVVSTFISVPLSMKLYRTE